MKWVVVYLAVFAVALGLLAVYEKFEIEEPLMILAISGALFPLLAWVVTRKAAPPSGFSMRAPWWGLLLYFTALGVLLVYGFPANPWLKVVAKLAVFVAVPLLAFRMRLPIRFTRRDVAITLILIAAMMAFQIVFGGGPKKIAAAGLHGTPLVLAFLATFVWMTIEAGLTEEIAFRALLQTRLEEWMQSKAGGIVIASIVFGLVHAPGLYLRTGGTGEDFSHPSLLFAIGYSIVILTPIALFFGYLWTRTRNVLMLALIHGALDTVPNVVEVAKILKMT